MVRIDDLSSEISKQVALYTAEVEEQVELAKQEVARDTVLHLKQNSPELTGDYKKGWKLKKEGNRVIVHNQSHYQLTHLLEYGHVKVGGGRVPAVVHIRPAEEKAISDFTERVEKAIKS
ncbi:HK97 gp10 family phage protein [Peribacillus alkalitolerans]|uniref:HK97 gp10 family phage protein n=1 Tax=Peribacillus alkalitolerans TaxID=1550385 RepID=UPI0013D385FF|nr:HK97 gp10 family phage protein [Peribacillus alkalitolerans]